MAKKNDQPTPSDSLEERHSQLRAERRALEAELAEIDSRLRTAITLGDLEALETIQARKANLPALFIAASTAETNARRALFNVGYMAQVADLESAQADRDKLQAKLTKRKQEHAAEIAALEADLQEAERRVNEATANINASCNAGADHDTGFKNSLAKLAGVVQ
jgi:DNA repair exonuclease SbcCD ATPase subunit